MAGIFSGLLGNPQERPVPGLLSGQVPPKRDWGQALQILGAGLRDVGDPNGQNLAMLNQGMAPQREAQAAAQMAAQQAQERSARADALGLQGRERDLYINAPEAYAGLAENNLGSFTLSEGQQRRDPTTGQVYSAPKYIEMGDQLVTADQGQVSPVFRRDQTYAETETNRANVAGEGLTARGQDVTMRGQDIGAETSRYGTNMGAQTAANRLGFDQGEAAREAAAPTASVGQEAVDRAFASDVYVPFVSGGASDATKNLQQLNMVIERLESGANLTGPIVGNRPDFVNQFANRNALDTRDMLEEVVQRNLREILGPQFTAQEGTRLIERAYNPRLQETDNAARVRRLYRQMELGLQAKADAARHFEQNGTLAGWQGRLPTLSDFEAAIEETGDAGAQNGDPLGLFQ